MSSDSTAGTYLFNDLRTGMSLRVPRDRDDPLKSAVAAAIERSHREDGVVQIAGTPYELFASFNTLCDGNATFSLAATTPLGGGKVPAGSIAYAAVVACRLASAPLGWRHLFSYYLRHTAAAPPIHSFNAPGPMPRSLPWLCGFMPAEARPMGKDEWAILSTLVPLIAANLLEKCETASQAIADSGAAPEVDARRYLELRDWDD